MNKNKYLTEKITTLELEKEIIHLLNLAGIFNINELWQKNRHDLKIYNLSDQQINQIIIKLQLIGLDLNHKIYN